MYRWIGILGLVIGTLTAGQAVEIIGLPETLGTTYDLTWQLTVTQAPVQPLIVEVETTQTRQGYQLVLDGKRIRWESPVGGVISVSSPITWTLNAPQILTLKRRPDTIAVLLNHHRVLIAPAPSHGNGSLRMHDAPTGITLGEVRYHPVEPCRLGDDFMRPEGLARFARAQNEWVEDDTWETAYYHHEAPGANPFDPTTHAEMVNPWQLSLFENTKTSVNGFWFTYTGIGPSWVVAKPTIAYPSWDRYALQAAVKPEYDSAVGLIVAYQDNRNYLLFRWTPREYPTPEARPHAELIAVQDGVSTVLASANRGFDPNQWYTLRVTLDWQRVQVFIDSECCLFAENPGLIEGRVGLYAQGVERPHRPAVDETTATMYVIKDEKTGQTINDAGEALRTTSCIYFDDVLVEPWDAEDDLLSSGHFTMDAIGAWTTTPTGIQAKEPARLLTGSPGWRHTALTARVRIPEKTAAGVFLQMNDAQDGWLWKLSTHGQELYPLKQGIAQPSVDTSSVGIAVDTWTELRAEMDGPYLTCFCNGRRVLEGYDPACAGGRCGVYAAGAGVQFGPLDVQPLVRRWRRVAFHGNFATDKWLLTWSSAEADWYPAVLPTERVTPAGIPLTAVGAAAPLSTRDPGLYWHKGGCFGDLRVTIPITGETPGGPVLHLTTAYRENAGYDLRVQPEGIGGRATLLRARMPVAGFPFSLTAHMNLVLERRGSYLLVYRQELDPDLPTDDAAVLKEQLLGAYRDPQPLKADQIGFTVTEARLPAARVRVESARVCETFEQAPVGWVTQSGIWAIMNRYSCQPWWNWFGGFGAGTPTVWSKARLDGDQVVEAYFGIKMQFDNAPEEYARRYRDVNMTICGDGAHLTTGYTVVRAGRPNGEPVTWLLRNGKVVQSSTDPAHLLPPRNSGHRMWFATRLEKRGDEIKVFLDNLLAMTYHDPQPLTGGQVALWTLENGIMVGRVNYAAERVTLGTPRAAQPLVVQTPLTPLPVPALMYNGTLLPIATFAAGLDGCAERPGHFTSRLQRERQGQSTWLTAVNTYPSGDASISLPLPRDVSATPLLHADYRFDPGSHVNLYLRQGPTWYVVTLTGAPDPAGPYYPAGALPAIADGVWHALTGNLTTLLTTAITKKTGQPPVTLQCDELVLADWEAPAHLRQYGFGNTPGGARLSLANLCFLPSTTGPLTLTWRDPANALTRWRIALDSQTFTTPTETTPGITVTLPAAPGKYFHLLGVTTDGTPGGMLHLCLP